MVTKKLNRNALMLAALVLVCSVFVQSTSMANGSQNADDSKVVIWDGEDWSGKVSTRKLAELVQISTLLEKRKRSQPFSMVSASVVSVDSSRGSKSVLTVVYRTSQRTVSEQFLVHDQTLERIFSRGHLESSHRKDLSRRRKSSLSKKIISRTRRRR